MNKINKKNGFSLIEVLVALTVIAIAFTAVIKLQGQSIMMSQAVKFYTVAPLLAQYKIADVENDEMDFIEGEGGFGEDFPNYSWQIDVEEDISCGSDEEDGADMNLKRIKILISDNSYKYSVIKYKFIAGDL